MIALKPCRAFDPCLSNPGVWIPCCDGRIVVCPWCNGYRAFAESNDEPEAVRVEIAAAARTVNEPVPRSLRVRAHDDPEETCLACAVMFLARAIETHRDSPWSVEGIATHEGES